MQNITIIFKITDDDNRAMVINSDTLEPVNINKLDNDMKMVASYLLSKLAVEISGEHERNDDVDMTKTKKRK